MPSKLRILSSNLLETLIEQLADQIGGQPLDPFEREVIVVESRGMYRWITLELARRLGVAATLATPFPGTFFRALAERLEGSGATPTERYEPTQRSGFEREALTWRLFALLAEARFETSAALAAYLADDPDQRKRYQLAVRLADRFDTYQLYRPRLLAAWAQGRQPDDEISPSQRDVAAWQAALWRALLEQVEQPPLPDRLERLATTLRAATEPPAGLPTRLSIFGASALPPIFVDVITELARLIPVDIYLTSPTYHYWGDLRSEREIARIRHRLQSKAIPADLLGLEPANRLFAALGRQGRELFNVLQDADADGSAWHQLDFPDPGRTTALACIQSDILHLVERGATNPPLALPENDRSIQVHVCHSPMREMEALRDAILEAFAEDSELRPADVFVLVPDVDAYAPYIDAAFGVERPGEPVVPYSVADRHPRAELAALDAAFRVIESIGTRLTAQAVVELLDASVVRRAARIEDHELATVKNWIEALNVRWGADREHRNEVLGIEAGPANTWRFGLDRLLLGYATGPVGSPVSGILPQANCAPGDSNLVGRLVVFVDTMLDHLRSLESPRTAARWTNDLGAALATLLAPQDETEERAIQLLRNALVRLTEVAGASGVDRAIDIEVVRESLRAAVSQEATSGGYLTGAVTFCRFEPMRTVPARLICVAGLSEDSFPRRDRPLTFDLMGQARRPGDPSARDADRWLFLETLLAARRRLVLSYVGRSERDNTPIAPSSVVSELLEQLDRTFKGTERGTASRSVVVDHRLQPFSEVYFGGRPADLAPLDDGGEPASRPRLSYSRENLSAAAAARGASTTEPTFVAGQLVPETGSLEIMLDDLIEFWVNPSRYFCNRVVGLALPRESEELAGTEPFVLDGLKRYQLLNGMVERRLAGTVRRDDELALLEAGGELPLAGFAASTYAALAAEADALVRRIHPDLPREPPKQFSLAGDGWHLVGSLDGLTALGQIRYRPATLRSKDRLRAWIRHVALNHAAQVGVLTAPARGTLVVGRDATESVGALAAEQAEHLLMGLLDGYREGQRRPIPVFERTSFEFAAREYGSKKAAARSVDEAIDYAREKGWSSDEFAPGRVARGDSEDAYIRLCTRGRDPLNEEFVEWARSLWRPFLEARTKV
jgi:exodeoxyribonuclease V gamma subunit